MPHPNTATTPDLSNEAGHETIDQMSPRYGVVVRDIFSDAGWTPAEPVRARDWHDCGGGSGVQSSETSFD